MKKQLISWLHSQEGNIQSIICHAAEAYIEKFKDKAYFKNDVSQCERESLNLIKGKDLCYDRPSIGLSYSLWYLGRRINTCLTFAIELVIDAINDKKEIEIFDLGAGTGAVQIAIGLCIEGINPSCKCSPQILRNQVF